MRLFFYCFLVGLIASCASTTQYVKLPDFSSTADPEVARIYVIRPTAYGSARKMKIYEDDVLIGKLGPKSYLCWEVDEGRILLKSTLGNEDYYAIEAKKGKTYYVRQRLRVGMVVSQTDLEFMDEEKAIAAINKLRKPKVEELIK